MFRLPSAQWGQSYQLGLSHQLVRSYPHRWGLLALLGLLFLPPLAPLALSYRSGPLHQSFRLGLLRPLHPLYLLLLLLLLDRLYLRQLGLLVPSDQSGQRFPSGLSDLLCQHQLGLSRLLYPLRLSDRLLLRLSDPSAQSDPLCPLRLSGLSYQRRSDRLFLLGQRFQSGLLARWFPRRLHPLGRLHQSGRWFPHL